MKAKRSISAVVIAASLALVAVAVVNGLSVLYVLSGAVLVIAALVLVRSFGSTKGRQWALSSTALLVIAALIVTPIQINTSRNPVLDGGPEDDAGWMSDGDGGGYAVTTRSIQHIDSSGDLDWERPASLATWSTPDGVVTSGRDRVRFISRSGDVMWKRTALDLGGTGDATVTPLAWADGVTTISVCTWPADVSSWPICRFVGVSAAGDEAYAIDGSSRSTVYPGGSFHFSNLYGTGATGALPTHFAWADVDQAQLDNVSLTVSNASDGGAVATVPAAGDGTTPPTFVGDRVLIGSIADDVCTMSALQLADDAGWNTEVPCLRYSDNSNDADTDDTLSDPYFETGLLDGDILWWRTDAGWLSGGGDLDAIGIDLETGETVPAGKVLWRSVNKADAATVALGTDGLLVEARDSTLSVRDPFTDTTKWTAPLQRGFRTADASAKALAVVTKPTRPQIFASDDDLELTVYALDDGRILGQHRFDPDKASHVLALDDSALLVFRDRSYIRVGG
jgi:hypothetical protein